MKEKLICLLSQKKFVFICKKNPKRIQNIYMQIKIVQKKNQQNSFCSFYFLFLFNDYCLNFDAKKQTLYLEIRGYLVLFLSCIHKHI